MGKDGMNGLMEKSGVGKKGETKRSSNPRGTVELNFEAVSPTNKRLVKRAIKGNAHAIDKVIDLYYRDILYFAIRKVGRQEGEDVAQQAITDIISNMESLKDPTKIKPWMMSIAHHKCVDYMKRSKRTDEVIVDEGDFDNDILLAIEDEDREFLPEEVLLDSEQRDLIMSIIDTLPENYADCLHLHYHDGLSYKEIAETLGVDLKKVKNDMYHGLALFKKRFEEQTGQKYRYSVVAAGAVPALTQAFNAHCSGVITPDMCSNLLSVAREASAAKGLAAGAKGAAAFSKIGVVKAVGATAAGLAVVGAGAVFVLSQEPEPTPIPEPEPTPVIEVIPEEPTQPQEPEEKEIRTLADMIGEEDAALVESFEAGAVDYDAWQALIARIGAELERTAAEPDYVYSVHVLEKQDKQLILVDRTSTDGASIETHYIFRQSAELPLMSEVIAMFY